MSGCPEGHGELGSDAEGLRCRRCQGVLLPFAAVEARYGGQLSVEDDPRAFVYRRPKACPSCDAVMTPHRVGAQELWVHRCPSCDEAWLEKVAQAALRRGDERARIEAAYRSLGEQERRELAQDLAAAHATERALSPGQQALTFLGIPVVTGIEGDKVPFATWALAGALVAAFLASSPDALGYLVGDSPWWRAVTAGFAHFGWLHLLGNVAFLLSFGDGVEQRLPRPALVAVFLVGGALTLGAEALVSSSGVLVAGASGAVALVVGACAVMQRGAKVAFRPAFWLALEVPILVYAALWLAWQVGMVLLEIEGVAWTAHIVGLVLGAGLGLAVRARSAPTA